MTESIKDKVQELEAALMENAILCQKENALKTERMAARLRLNIAKDNLRAFEEDMMFLLETKELVATTV